MTTIELKIQCLHPKVQLPEYATAGAACFDIRAFSVNGSTVAGANVWPSKPVTCGTGLAFEVPAGHVMLVFSRSGHGFHDDVRLANCVGVIDSDYRGEVAVKLSCDDHGVESVEGLDGPPLLVQPGDRIAQALVLPVRQVSFHEVDELSRTRRGAAGLGSTGSK